MRKYITIGSEDVQIYPLTHGKIKVIMQVEKDELLNILYEIKIEDIISHVKNYGYEVSNHNNKPNM